jgi:MFS family permease
MTPSAAVQRLPASIWALGFVSLLMDISSEMIHSLLPVFMVTVLGTSMWAIGLIEGAAEATAMIVKVFSGVLSDWWGKRKPLALLGYGLGAASKPLFALATTTRMVVTARLTDRVGKGIRGAPRDALVADSCCGRTISGRFSGSRWCRDFCRRRFCFPAADRVRTFAGDRRLFGFF